MSDLIYSLEFDPTGINRDNRIEDEPHSLSVRPVRAIVPFKGLFYAQSVIIRDGAKALTRGVEYQTIELHQDLTSKTGLDVCAGILILNPEVGQDITVTYQAVGGPYETDNQMLLNIYESFLKDQRPVEWENVLNKPNEFPPTAHDHWLSDVVGWEPIIYQLERVVAAINMSQIDVTLSTVNKLLDRYAPGQLPLVRPNSNVVQYHHLLYFQTRRKISSDAWIDVKDYVWRQGTDAEFYIDTSEYPVDTLFHWSFFKPDGAPIHFPIQKNGVVRGNGSIVKVTIYVPTTHQHEREEIYLGLQVDRNNNMWSNKVFTTVDGKFTKDFNVPGIEDRFLPVPKESTRKFENEFDAVSLAIKLRPAYYSPTTYGLLSNLKPGIDSDELYIQPEFDHNDYERAKFMTDNISFFKHN